MNASGWKPSLLPILFCLLAGLSFGLIVICYYHVSCITLSEVKKYCCLACAVI